MFRKILIANRGEIACRIMRTARRLGIATIAVYSAADAHARHVAEADEAWPIGPAAARESYLSIPRILDAARRSGAEAIHPGYGFLSENAEFAEACASAGVVFIGPPAAAIRAMGSKAAAKALMAASGVPLVPGYHGEAQDGPSLARAAAEIGYPVLVKASAGGGGRGMRIVQRAADLDAALGAARREALAAFGDQRLLLEKFLVDPRHIEIQIFADMHGNAVSLFERDCSIQRRYQKIIEEAPAPGMTAERRRAMGEAAIRAARAVGYVGAGTVEFIVAGNRFSFMEMNTRLQVEHAVTELVTGQDLVEWQIRISAGEPLPSTASDLTLRGHAIEARVYAEDPANDFLPSVGRLIRLREPTPDARIDSGVRENDTIGTHYDAMLGKLIVWGEDRASAVRKLSRALAGYEVVGVQTNLDLLRAIASDPDYAAARIDTGFIPRHAADLMEGRRARSPDVAASVRAAAALAWLAEAKETAARANGTDIDSPWGLADGWRVNGVGWVEFSLVEEGEELAVRAFPLGPDRYRLELPGRELEAAWIGQGAERERAMRVDGVVRPLAVVREGLDFVVIYDGRNYRFSVLDPFAPPLGGRAVEQRVIAPIPARVARVFVHPGDRVAKGAPLVVLEAMKMELTLAAPRGGVVGEVRCEAGDMVAEGAELVIFDRAVEAKAPA